MAAFIKSELHLALFSTLFFCVGLLSAQVDIYPVPPGIKAAPDYKVKINGRESFVYNSEPAAFTIFSFEGKADLEIETTYDIKWVDIRPLSDSIRFSYSAHNITFSLNQPRQLSIELNGESSRPLYIFANPPQSSLPDSSNKNVICFKGGKVYDIGKLKLKDDQIIYLEGGAVVRGAVEADNVENAVIKGYGIFDGSVWGYNKDVSNYVKQKMMVFNKCKNITIDGITILDSPGWTMTFKNGKDIVINNVKHVNWRYGSDGIDLVSTSDVKISNCFLRDNDDNITIKSWGGELKYPLKKAEGLSVKNIFVENCVIWNMAWGNGMEIGFELRCPRISDITFRDIDIIHVERGAAMSIHNGDYAVVENILYDDIRVEDARHKLIDLGIFISQYSLDRHPDEKERTKRYLHGAWDGVQDARFYGKEKHAGYRGKIRDITFRNIRIVDGKIPFSLMCGYDKQHNIENVTFENIRFYDKKISSGKEAKMHMEYTDNIKWNE